MSSACWRRVIIVWENWGWFWDWSCHPISRELSDLHSGSKSTNDSFSTLCFWTEKLKKFSEERAGAVLLKWSLGNYAIRSMETALRGRGGQRTWGHPNTHVKKGVTKTHLWWLEWSLALMNVFGINFNSWLYIFLNVLCWLRWVFIERGPALVAVSWGYSSRGARASHCGGLSSAGHRL